MTLQIVCQWEHNFKSQLTVIIISWLNTVPECSVCFLICCVYVACFWIYICARVVFLWKYMHTNGHMGKHLSMHRGYEVRHKLHLMCVPVFYYIQCLCCFKSKCWFAWTHNKFALLAVSCQIKLTSVSEQFNNFVCISNKMAAMVREGALWQHCLLAWLLLCVW